MSKNKFSKRLAASLIAAATIGSSGVLSSLTYLPVHAADTDNYAKLLQYSMYFYDGNMCGDDVDSASAFDWRGDCHTGDEVVGGFHDAGDHVKFGLPAGYSAATLGWGYYEFKDAYDSLGQTAHLKEITNRFSKYFKDCTTLSGDTVTNFCYQIGQGGGGNDHGYWGPAETQEAIKGKRTAYWTSNGASDIAAAYSAALAVNYLNFGNAEDLKYAKALYDFSVKYNKSENETTSPYYNSFDYYDDQAWAAGWLYLATGDSSYKTFLDTFMNSSGQGMSGQSGCQWGVYSPMNWNNVSMGAAILQAEITKSASDWAKVTTYLDSKATSESQYYCEDSWGSARHNVAVQMTALITSKYKESGKDYSSWAKAQMGMILGDNSTGKNLVVGFNDNSPKYPHHRSASGHTYDPTDEGTPAWDEANGHVLVGALVGGPSSSDFSTYKDTIDDAKLNEVALDYNAGLVGAAAGLYTTYKTGSLESNIPGVGATPTTTAATTTTTAAVTTTKAAETAKAPTTTAAAQGGGYYSIKPNQDVVYKELPANDKMLGWSYEELGVKAGEKVQKVEIDISTTADKIGKWQGAFGSSTKVEPECWTQTGDMEQTISGDSGTLVWNVDSATSDIIQTQYGGQVKVGFWWIDCNEFTIDAVRVYTDKSSTNPTTTAAVTTATTKATTTTTKAATTTAAPSTTAAPTTTTKLVVGNEPTMAVNNGEKIFVTPEQKYAQIPLNLYNAPDTEGITVAFKTDGVVAATQALLNANSDSYQSYYAVDEFLNLGSWEENPKGLSWGVPSSGTQ
ncbi:MAG: glycoside hydrolase family 9 protein, partial [Ruminococcus sp.]|nr:glycoside hydrolase family 9 protein [Ruminococcus sp.]